MLSHNMALIIVKSTGDLQIRWSVLSQLFSERKAEMVSWVE